MPLKEYPLETALWAHTAADPPETGALEGERHVDVAIIGAGYTGLSSALHLAKEGVNVAVVEAAQIGYGGSGRNASHCNPTFIMHTPRTVRETLGEKHGRQMVRMQTGAADLVFNLIRRYEMNCEAQQTGIINAAHTPSAMDTCLAKFDAYSPYIDGCRMLSKDEVTSMTGSDKYFGGWYLAQGGHLNPLGYARELARAVIEEGGEIFTGSPVKRIVSRNGKWSVETGTGSVIAERVIVGTNAYTEDFWQNLDSTFYRVIAYNVASEPLGKNVRRSILPGGHNVIDTRGHTHYYKLDKDGRLVTGSVLAGKRGAARQLTNDVYNRRMQYVFPQLGELHWPWLWYGYLAVTRETLPRIYELAAGVTAAIGYSGRGVPTATAMGKEVAQMITTGSTDHLPLPITRPSPLRGRQAMSFLVPLFLGPYKRWQDANSMKRDGLSPPSL